MKHIVKKIFDVLRSIFSKAHSWIINLPKKSKNLYYRFLHWKKWKKRIWKLRYYPTALALKHIAKSVLSTIIWLLSFCVIVWNTDLFFVENQLIQFSNSVASLSNSDALSILGTQISITLVCLSIISLIANSEKKYIMGERATDLAFPEKGPFSFKVILSVIFILLFSNLFFILTSKPIGLILLVFISSTYLTAYTIYRYAIVLLGQRSQKNKLYAQYYRENIKHIKRFKPLENHIQPKLQRYHNVVLSQIANKELDSYRDNIEYHFSILGHVLFNHKKSAQNYYTEMGSIYDISGNITSFIHKLLSEGQYQESIGYLNRLLSQYNYHRIINVENHRFHLFLDDHIQVIKAITTESELRSYMSYVLKLIDLVHYQIYLFTTEDLSYCRVADIGIHLLASNRSYENLYTSVKENPHLQDYEKSRIYELIFDHIRMTDHQEQFPLTNINDLLANRSHHKEKEIFPYEIKGEPIATLFLSLLEHQDYDNVYFFSRMNLAATLGQFVFTLVSLSVINIAHLNNKRIYYLDINVDVKKAQEAIQHVDMCVFSIAAPAFKNLYKFILEHYTAADNKPDTYVSGSVYLFTPRFRFLKKVVDAFFYELAIENNLQDCFFEENPTYQNDPSLSDLICKFKRKDDGDSAQINNS